MTGEASHPGDAGATIQVAQDRYEVGERLPHTAFFHVYRAHDREHDRPVLLKVLKPEFAGNEAFVSRLQTEVDAAASLSQSQIAEVYESWREGGTLVIAAECVRGISLSDRIERVAPFPLGVAVDIAIGIAEALEHGVHHGIVHGDLRPECVTVTPEGEVKLGDFGVGASLGSNTSIQLTALPGAVAYLAPEVAGGRPPTAVADVYSLGIILHEMLAGSPPFEADTPLAVAMKHQSEPPPPLRTLCDTVPPALEGIVLRCLQKKPGARYVSVLALLHDLRRVQQALRTDQTLNWTPQMPTPLKKEIPVATRSSGGRAESGGPSWVVLAVVLPAVLLLLIGAGYWGLSAITAAPPDVQVPGVIGQTTDSARGSLERSGLQSIVREEYHQTQPEGVVYSSEPLPNELVKEGATVTLYVSRGERPVKVPDVVGMGLTAARQAIRDAKLTPGTLTEEFNENVDKGQVISQAPSGTVNVDAGSTVDLIVSKGPEPVPEEPAAPTVDVTPLGTDGGFPPESQPDATLVSQFFDVDIHVPDGGGQRVRVRVLLSDLDGIEREEYNQLHDPGEDLTVTLQARAAAGAARIQVFFDSRLTFDRRF